MTTANDNDGVAIPRPPALPAQPDSPAGPAVTVSLVSVPGGTLEMRDARSNSSRTVTLVPYSIGRTQITAAELAQAGGSPAAPERAGLVPVHPVTWFDAVRWCNNLSSLAGLRPAYAISSREVSWDVGADGYRLPTEAEWEFACRAGTLTPTYGPLPDIAWTAADRVDAPREVALKAPNAFGLFDMIGNVWEWCWDYADTARYGDYRTLRGGGWADKAWSTRASVRRGSAPDAVLEDVGFRVARGPVGEPGAHEAQGWSAAADRRRADITGPLPVGWTPHRGLR
ncbi:formylglycine-generating enzyme family protein [Arthrobacter sp. MSA 4-2]|uniref:formylglycine-generating enzyme family protein n=1 Tax=Arthrobacter sp. MSA 4-2 TaxID=2794349 RepID=UPI0018E7C285|nr:SUMF1/EgtB/PvdO family nonheme iron enzyme [Arthrobacter sp. MSA 4-2]MBJ2121345.1 formylglycine-generating enzyme family protein [Arthrobacter sp. MSA 4-2]